MKPKVLSPDRPREEQSSSSPSSKGRKSHFLLIRRSNQSNQDSPPMKNWIPGKSRSVYQTVARYERYVASVYVIGGNTIIPYPWIVLQPEASPGVSITDRAKPFFEIGQFIIWKDKCYVSCDQASWGAPAARGARGYIIMMHIKLSGSTSVTFEIK